MDKNLLIVVVSAAVLIILTYILTKSSANKKVAEYKSIDEALKLIKDELHVVKTESEQASRELGSIFNETESLRALQKNENTIAESLAQKTKELEAVELGIEDGKSSFEMNTKALDELMGKLDLYSRIDEYTSCGHFEKPQYLYETSVRYAEEIKEVRLSQKEMIKDKAAIIYPSYTVISNDAAYNRKILDAQVKLMLTAFNTECDFLIGKVSPSSFARTLERIEKLANNIEKLCATFECGFNLDYIELKFEECKLQYQYMLKKEEEQIEQKSIKEQIREEQRAIKEFQKAIADAEKEEKMYRKMLEKAREELNDASDEEKELMERRIAELQTRLEEAESKEQRAKSMAEQTRKGHVYVISNIGSFGEDVYKIGLTRRLEPMDRVKELGDASVPFSFDVHAMIYSDDAPALEAALHREFHTQRVNAVNTRKEFFQVDLESIQEAVEKIAGFEAEFKMTALAEDYYESLRLQDAA
ncbi:DUF4041 domain-containing protein [Vibrio chagasii]|uniref:DUF4041 domain-containing protein n=1 Tax=Vibrio chagasii TaxID=170679 RepID=UPI001EFD0C12|nr:DUF4041 domain-containing protein [Vibrio chagasii]MCG9567471.1 DUF4041 domain-containing protein [Vibrio chagasii]